MRGKEPVSNWEPEDEEDEELIWERLRAHQASDAAPARARSEVVPRTRVAGEPQVSADPYASYANHVQSTRETPAYGVSAVRAAYEAAEEVDSDLQGELQDEEDEEDEEAIWERLRNSNASNRVSDIAALGAHHAYDNEPIEDEQTTAYAQEAYDQQGYAQQQQAYAQQQYEQQQYEQRQAYEQQEAYEQQQQAYAQQQYEQQQQAYAQQQHEQQQQAYAQQQYEQQQQAYAQQQYEQQQQAYAQQQYEQQQAHAQQQYEQQQYEQAQLFAQQSYEQQQAHEQAYGQQGGYDQQQLFAQHNYGGSPYMREAHQADPFSPLPAYAAQPAAAAPQQASRTAMDPTWTGSDLSDDSYAPKRKGRGLAITLVAGVLLAAGGGVAMRYAQQAAPTLVPSSDLSAATMAAPAAEPALGADEMRARDAVFGTHTAPPAAAPTPAPAPEPVAAAPTPSALPSTPSALPASSKSAPAAKGKAAAGKKGKAAKAKAKPAAKASHAASPKAAKKPAREKPDQTGLGGIAGKRSNDPLDGI